jgi:hypothetical protein
MRLSCTTRSTTPTANPSRTRTAGAHGGPLEAKLTEDLGFCRLGGVPQDTTRSPSLSAMALISAPPSLKATAIKLPRCCSVMRRDSHDGHPSRESFGQRGGSQRRRRDPNDPPYRQTTTGPSPAARSISANPSPKPRSARRARSRGSSARWLASWGSSASVTSWHATNHR